TVGQPAWQPGQADAWAGPVPAEPLSALSQQHHRPESLVRIFRADEYTLATRQPAALQGDPVQDGRTATARAGGGRAGTGAHSTGTAAGHAQREGGRTCDRRQDAAVAATAISAGTEDPGWFGGAELVARATLKSTPQRWPLEVARQPIGKRFK